MELNDTITSIISAIITGGASAATTIKALWADTTKRIETLEKIVGSPGSGIEPKTGLHYVFHHITESVKKNEEAIREINKLIDSWERIPPDWAYQIVNRKSVNYESQELENRLRRLEEQLSKFEDFITRNEYHKDNEIRANEISKIDANLKETMGFLRGVLSVAGNESLIKPPNAPIKRR